MRSLTLHFVLLLVMATPVGGQLTLGVRFGAGGGSAAYMLGEVSGRVRVSPSVQAVAAYEVMGGLWACVDSPRDEIRCGYSGNSVSAGIAYTLIRSSRLYGTVRGLMGRFERTGTYGGRQYEGSKHMTAAVAADVEFRIWGPIAVQTGLFHRQIFDNLYREAIGPFPHITGYTVGLSVALWST